MIDFRKTPDEKTLDKIGEAYNRGIAIVIIIGMILAVLVILFYFIFSG